MIHRVFPSLNDYENLSRLKLESSDFANNFDYRDIVVNKPWGYEYLWFQNEAVAIWFLRIIPGQSTSLHCHVKKRTSLIVLDGSVQCTTLDDKYQLNTLEAMVLEPCVFHSSLAVGDQGAFIMEIETPPMKGDLVRMHDAYGRQGTGYEKTKEYSKDFSLYEYYPFKEGDYDGWKFRNLEIQLSDKQLATLENVEMVVPINVSAKSSSKMVIEIGEAVSMKESEFVGAEIITQKVQYLVFKKL